MYWSPNARHNATHHITFTRTWYLSVYLEPRTSLVRATCFKIRFDSIQYLYLSTATQHSLLPLNHFINYYYLSHMNLVVVALFESDCHLSLGSEMRANEGEGEEEEKKKKKKKKNDHSRRVEFFFSVVFVAIEFIICGLWSSGFIIIDLL